MKYRPTSEDKQILRKCAQRSAGYPRVSMRIGERHNLEREAPRSMNIALVTKHPDWDDTDLWAQHDWQMFTKGVELTDDGRGIFDFYVSNTGHEAELQTNVVAYVEDGKLVRIEGTCDGVLWKA
jgi:hypothetical protein